MKIKDLIRELSEFDKNLDIEVRTVYKLNILRRRYEMSLWHTCPWCKEHYDFNKGHFCKYKVGDKLTCFRKGLSEFEVCKKYEIEEIIRCIDCKRYKFKNVATYLEEETLDMFFGF